MKNSRARHRLERGRSAWAHPPASAPCLWKQAESCLFPHTAAWLPHGKCRAHPGRELPEEGEAPWRQRPGRRALEALEASPCLSHQLPARWCTSAWGWVRLIPTPPALSALQVWRAGMQLHPVPEKQNHPTGPLGRMACAPCSSEPDSMRREHRDKSKLRLGLVQILNAHPGVFFWRGFGAIIHMPFPDHLNAPAILIVSKRHAEAANSASRWILP